MAWGVGGWVEGVVGFVDGSHGTVIPSLVVPALVGVGDGRHNTFLLVFADFQEAS